MSINLWKLLVRRVSDLTRHSLSRGRRSLRSGVALRRHRGRLLWQCSALLCGTAVAPVIFAYDEAASLKLLENKAQLIHGYWVGESDILLGRAGDEGSGTWRALGLSQGLTRWPNGIVPYELDESLGPVSRDSVEAAIEHWNSRSSVTLAPRSPSVFSEDADFLLFVNGPGCASWVGRQGRQQEIWVSDFCTTGSMIHEIGHALGLLHEHTRNDRDLYLQVLWDNIQPDKRFNFEINSSGTVDVGDYDYRSIMHYGEYFFSSNGQPTLIPLNAPSDVAIGQRVALSEGDLGAIDQLYGTDLALSATQSVDAGQYDVTLTVSNRRDWGAHDIELSLHVSEALQSFTADEIWQCREQDAQLRCSLPVLNGSATSAISFRFDGVVDLLALEPVVTAKTHDFEPANNRLTEPAIGSAEDATAGRTALAAGGGALHPAWLLLLATLVLPARRTRVIRSRR